MSSPAGQSNAAQGLTFSQMAQQQYNNTHAGQRMMQQSYHQTNNLQQNQLLNSYNRVFEAKRWMINGQAMDIEEFGKELFGDDTPELTMFLLRYAEKGNDEKV
jgi:hypothetical protein